MFYFYFLSIRASKRDNGVNSTVSRRRTDYFYQPRKTRTVVRTIGVGGLEKVADIIIILQRRLAIFFFCCIILLAENHYLIRLAVLLCAVEHFFFFFIRNSQQFYIKKKKMMLNKRFSRLENIRYQIEKKIIIIIIEHPRQQVGSTGWFSTVGKF